MSAGNGRRVVASGRGAVASGRRAVAAGLALVGAATLISACGIPSRPLWWPKPKHTTGQATTGQAAAAGRRPAPRPSPVPVVAHPWHPGLPQLGIDVYWINNPRDPADVVAAKARRIINYAISLDANSIGLSFPFYTYGLTSDTVYADPKTTPSPASIGIFLAAAQASHIRVTLRPLLNEASLIAQNPLAWRGSIEPADRSAWFAGYRALLLRYASVAQAGHAATFVIGTELDSMQGDPRWPALIRSIQAAYQGELLYDENYLAFQDHDADLPLSTFGVDAYPRFGLSDAATVGELASAWEGWLAAHRPSVLKTMVLSEVGIAAVSGAYQVPGDWTQTVNSPIVPVVQTRWYRAVCRAAAAEHVAGVYWWEISFDADPAAPAAFQTDRLTFLGRPAQQEIKTCFARFSPSG